MPNALLALTHVRSPNSFASMSSISASARAVWTTKAGRLRLPRIGTGARNGASVSTRSYSAGTVRAASRSGSAVL